MVGDVTDRRLRPPTVLRYCYRERTRQTGEKVPERRRQVSESLNSLALLGHAPTENKLIVARASPFRKGGQCPVVG